MSVTMQIPVPTVGDQLRALERQVDALLETEAELLPVLSQLPTAARIVLRSVSSLLMAARHLWEDHRIDGERT